MFKKVFQIAATFALLLGAYQGYVLGFAVVSSRLVHGRVKTRVQVFTQQESKTAKEAARLAAACFGEGHWAADKDLKWRIYDKERGYFLYYQNYERLEGGKRIKLWPFAIVWMSKNGAALKSAQSKEAVVDLSEPLGLLKPSSAALHVTHAMLLGDVRMRDDKGTPKDPTDDLFVGPLARIEYDEAQSRIYTDSDVDIRDRNLVAFTRGLEIVLRKPSAPGGGGGAGFEAKSATLLSKVHIVVKNVGDSGVLPGSSRAGKGGRPTPLDARCDAELRIDFPVRVPPPKPGLVGPPRLEGPTYAVLNRNVVVTRGDVDPDQLNSDVLRLTLVPLEKKREAANADAATAKAQAESREGPLTELTLVEANAKGHAVWLQSKAQGLVARCNELIYNKFVDGSPDETYLRADTGKQIYVEKTEVPDPNKPGAALSVATIFAFDAKIFDDGRHGDASTVVARGPGKYESRPGRDKPVERSAEWGEELILRTDAVEGGESRRRLTLNGRPRLVDHAKEMTLEAKKSVVASLRPRPSADAGSKSAAKSGEGALGLEWVQAREDVVLKSPGKHMTARDQLDATFDEATNPASANRPAAGKGIANPFGPVVATKPAATPPPAEAAPAKKPAEIPVVVKANRVWAKIRQRAEGEAPEILEAMLRGGVSFHQDPPAGKQRGLDVTGEAVDVVNQGDGLLKFKNYWLEPSARGAATRLASDRKPENAPLAKIVTEDRYIEGEVIGLDQRADYAWASGPGKIIQLVEPGLLSEKGFDRDAPGGPDAPKPADPRPRVPFTIRWKDGMKFFGQAKDPKGRDAGKAEFRGSVQAWMDDAVIFADELDTYTDRVVKFDKGIGPLRTAGAGAPAAKLNPDDLAPGADAQAETEAGRPQLAYLDARGPQVVVVYAKRDPKTRAIVDKQRIQGTHIAYDKSAGEFDQFGPGVVHLWRHRTPTDKEKADLVARPVARPVSGADPDRVKAQRQADAEAALGPWELTQITFTERMKGRFGLGRDRDRTDPRAADFYGQVQTMVAGVKNSDSGLNFDRPPADFKFLTADALRVVEFPPEAGAPKGAPATHALTAEGKGNARDATHTIAGDLITYDSSKGLFHVYGLAGREVVVIDQKNPGLDYSNARGEAVRYNHKDGRAELINPSTVTMLDGEGVRARPGVAAPPDAKAPRRPRTPLRPPPLGNMERKGFSGR